MPADQPLITRFPNSLEPLPSESAILDQNDIIHVNLKAHLSVSTVDVQHIGSFGRQTQAACLLDQVLNMIQIIDIQTNLSEVAKADQNLMELLGILLEKSDQEEEHYCGSIAICIRYVGMFPLLLREVQP